LRKSIIVTGASSGIGKAAVIKLVEAGYQVFGLARRYNDLTSVHSEIPSLKENENKEDDYIALECDITKPYRFDDIINDILSRAKGSTIYGLVNNAGFVEPGAIEDITIQDMRNQIETNFFGLVELTKKVLPFMLDINQGRIVNVSSVAGLISLPLIGAYSASKYALEAVTDALRMELWDTNIKVITINPGIINTNINAVLKPKLDNLIEKKSSRFSEIYRRYIYNVPEGLPPESVASVILNAISSQKPKARYIVGSRRLRLGVKLRKFVPDRIFFSQVANRIHQK
jgi:NAD(P)-dependent dehydrogenase (short-subunit alcohol dehydrogenase family)